MRISPIFLISLGFTLLGCGAENKNECSSSASKLTALSLGATPDTSSGVRFVPDVGGCSTGTAEENKDKCNLLTDPNCGTTN